MGWDVKRSKLETKARTQWNQNDSQDQKGINHPFRVQNWMPSFHTLLLDSDILGPHSLIGQVQNGFILFLTHIEATVEVSLYLFQQQQQVGRYLVYSRTTITVCCRLD
jgi:hypothetical protein